MQSYIKNCWGQSELIYKYMLCMAESWVNQELLGLLKILPVTVRFINEN